MVTIKDVARDAGVSVGTVSNVLNGGRVSEARRKLVEASIEKLGYQVNTLAKGMRMQKTDYVVVILPNLINPYFALSTDDIVIKHNRLVDPLLCRFSAASQPPCQLSPATHGMCDL